jgi:hypothetical protein
VSVPVGPVVYAVYVNGVRVTDVILDTRIEATWGQHDMVSVRIEYNRMYPMSTIKPWADDAIVQVVWGRRPNALVNWYGYVSHHEMTSEADSGTHNLQYTYYCIGTSKPLNSEASRVWGDVTPTYVAKMMAQKYRLRCVVTSTSWVLSGEVQANMSDFAYMNYLAAKTGYRFWVSGGTLYFINPAVLLQGSSHQAVPVFTQDKSLTKQDTVRKFQLLRGDSLPGSTVATRQISGIDVTTGHIFQASTGSGAITKQNTTRVATSWSGGNQILAAWQALSQFWIGATAELFGSAGLYPGKVVYLQGTALPGGNTGYWIVVSARHVLLASGTSNPTADKYVTQCVLMRNTSATIPTIKSTVVVNPEFTACTASGGQWYSTDQRVIVDGVISG